MIRTNVDPRVVQIRHREAIRIGMEWLRISSAVWEDLPLDKQPRCAQAPPSVVSMSKKVYRFNPKTLPLDGMLNEYGGGCQFEEGQGGMGAIAYHCRRGGWRGDRAGMRGITEGASTTLLSSYASDTPKWAPPPLK